MSTAASASLSQSVLNKAYPEYEYKQPPVNDDWVAEIYQPPPLIKALTGHVRYLLGPRAEYDEHQRRFTGPSADVEEQYAKATWIEKIRYVMFGGTGNVLKERPFPWKDQYQRSGFCPEFYNDCEWKFPRRTFLNKYVPPPKDGVYEDTYHVKEHYMWVLRELHVYNFETAHVKEALQACAFRHPQSQMIDCRAIMDLYINMCTKTNVEKVKMLLWSGVPAVKDGNFHVRY
eukprot:Rhum_TRINITY_DN25523_c0_g1::Rhum_TRINITY_DN25523_c0_g1_i1::g.182331::m.182331